MRCQSNTVQPGEGPCDPQLATVEEVMRGNGAKKHLSLFMQSGALKNLRVGFAEEMLLGAATPRVETVSEQSPSSEVIALIAGKPSLTGLAITLEATQRGREWSATRWAHRVKKQLHRFRSRDPLNKAKAIWSLFPTLEELTVGPPWFLVTLISKAASARSNRGRWSQLLRCDGVASTSEAARIHRQQSAVHATPQSPPTTGGCLQTPTIRAHRRSLTRCRVPKVCGNKPRRAQRPRRRNSRFRNLNLEVQFDPKRRARTR